MMKKEHFNVNKDCGLRNESQQCKKCKFITHSMGLLRMHEKENHTIKHPFDKIIDWFKFDDTKNCVPSTKCNVLRR